MKRSEQVQIIIDSGNIVALLNLIEGYPCACIGEVDGEPLCRCRMNSKQVRESISYAGLKLGRLIRLKRVENVS